MAEWFQPCRIDTVAMQHTKNVPGRKTGVRECRWLMKLHTSGLMRDSFRLRQDMECVRTIWQAIVTAILGGERDPLKLADLADYRVKATAD
jgi:hypothetical protein